MDMDKILSAIGFTECSSFGEFCGGLGSDRPEAGDRVAWREVFTLVNQAERQGLIEVDRVDGKINSLQLTEPGASRIREKLDSKRPLFGAL
jgi:hypothetical protein